MKNFTVDGIAKILDLINPSENGLNFLIFFHNQILNKNEVKDIFHCTNTVKSRL